MPKLHPKGGPQGRLGGSNTDKQQSHAIYLHQARQNRETCSCAAAEERGEHQVLAAAQKQDASKEILLWMTPSEAPKALQASECSELLDPTRASCWISAQHQPGKFTIISEHRFHLSYVKPGPRSDEHIHLNQSVYIPLGHVVSLVYLK